jgi:Zn-dependent peptidase ImmA (M78 family)
MAKKITATVKPEILAWARRLAGFSLEAAAERLEIDLSLLIAWESASEEALPSIPQLRKLAALYKVPLAAMYLPEPPRGFNVIRDLRRLPGVGLRAFSPELTYELRRARERRALALEMAEDLGAELRHFEVGATLDEHPEKIGARIREALQVTSQDQLGWRDQDGRASFRAWRSRIEAAGVLVFQTTSIASEEASGFAVFEDRLPIIAVNRKDALTRRTFSLLHEFAHLLLHVSGVSDLERDAKRPPEDQRLEVFCNEVAANALVPSAVLLGMPVVRDRQVSATNWSDAEIAELAKSFGVSRETLVRRLLTLRKTTEAFYRTKREQYLAEHNALKIKERERANDKPIPRNMPQEAISNIGKPLVRMVLDSYFNDRITLSDVAGYLDIKTKHIAKLEQIAGFA